MGKPELSGLGPEATLLDFGNFITRFAGAQPQNRCVRRLHALLSGADAAAPLSTVVEWLEDVALWVHFGGRLPGASAAPGASARLKLLLDALDDLPEQKRALQAMVARCFEETSGVELFADTGLPGEAGFFSEMSRRFATSVLPEPPVERQLARLLHRLFPDARAAQWFEQLDEAALARLWSALAVPTGPAMEPLRRSMREAAVLLATRVSGAGLHHDFRARLALPSLSDSPFLALPRVAQRWADASGAAEEQAVRECIAACRKAAREVMGTLNRTGISLDLVYQLELVSRMLDRLYALVMVSSPQRPQGSERRLLHALVRGGVRDRSLKELWRTNSRLLARRVIERAGHGGEHYIVASRSEQHELLDSAGGGGALTGLAVALKFLLLWWGLPPLFDGLFIGLNYAAAFVSMQLVGATLATKQPAMTAATLAGAIQETQAAEEPDLTPLAEMVARTLRSQLAALVGNFGMVIPVVALIDLVTRAVSGHSFLSVEQAHEVVAKHHPLFSPTLVYAAFTGVFLWLASVIGGTVENWFVVQQLPEALASNRVLRRAFGSARAAAFSRWLLERVSGLAGNVSFGLMLGLAPFFASLVGLPFEVRHFTFVTGQLTFAGMALGPFGLDRAFLLALSSIALVGAVNFFVSFSLALYVALRAREVGGLWQLRLARAVWARFKQGPLDFVRAPLAPRPG